MHSELGCVPLHAALEAPRGASAAARMDGVSARLLCLIGSVVSVIGIILVAAASWCGPASTRHRNKSRLRSA